MSASLAHDKIFAWILPLATVVVFAAPKVALANYQGANATTTIGATAERGKAELSLGSRIMNAPVQTTLPQSAPRGAYASYVSPSLPEAQLPVSQSAIQPLITQPLPQQQPTVAPMDSNLFPMLLQMASQAIQAMSQQRMQSIPMVSDDYEYISESSGAYDAGASYDEKGEIISTFARIDQVNQKQTAPAPEAAIVSPVQPVPPEAPVPSCTTCDAPTIQDPRFEVCKDSNGFFEDFLAKAENPGLAALSSHTPKSSTLTCIAQNIPMVRTNNYRYCEAGNGPYGSKVARPCASQNMVKALSSAFELTTECLAGYMDPAAETDSQAKESLSRALFQLVSHESGWSPNAVSYTGAGGLGQMTQGAIEDVNKKILPGILARVQGHSNAACQSLSKANYEPMNGSRSDSCERVTMSNGNPQLNLMYTLGHLKMVRNAIEGSVNALNLPSATRAQLIDQVMVWGHNVGSGGIAQILRITIQKHSNLLRSGDVDLFLREMKNDVRSWHQANSRRSPTEPTQFLSVTQDRLAALEARVNGKCGAANE